MSNFFIWLSENKEWVFSGIGVTALVLVGNFFFNKGKTINQIQTGGDGSSMQQAGGDITNK